MSVAIDLGSTEFRSLRRVGERLFARRISAEYCVLPETPALQRMLEQSRTPYLTSEGQLLVIGPHAAEASEIHNMPLVPVIDRHGLPQDDPVGRQVCAAMLAAILPQRSTTTIQHLTPCFVTLPADAEPDSATGLFFQRLLRLQGYALRPIQSGTALVISSMAYQGYSGLGICFGAESVSCCLSQHGIPQWQTTFLGGANHPEKAFARAKGNFLHDREGNRYLDLQPVRALVSSNHFSLSRNGQGDAEILATYYRSWLTEVANHLAAELRGMGLLRSFPMPVVLSGGPVQINGFAAVFAQMCREYQLPLDAAQISVTSSDRFTVARGALILGLLNAEQPGITLEAAA
ncbi:MAG: hypothetical protein KDA58_02825 [Planctomycetaceae bacterium]|nr:hypothetical protein [Planctomycetaceae bacterium]